MKILDTLRVWLQTTLQGKMTYTFAVLSIVGSVYGWIEGYISSEVMMQTVSTSLMALGLRRGLSNYSGILEQLGSTKKN
jgi:type IV secretory pathway VirB2 component (pilin)